jgi:hypothetical protein
VRIEKPATSQKYILRVADTTTILTLAGVTLSARIGQSHFRRCIRSKGNASPVRKLVSVMMSDVPPGGARRPLLSRRVKLESLS